MRAFLAFLALCGASFSHAADLSACLAKLQPLAKARGVSSETYARHTRGLVADPTVLEALDAQPEFVTPIWDYLAGLVDAERIADGKRMLREHAATLADVSAQYRVDKEAIVAVWGVESDFGRVAGKRPLLVSLATLACEGRRQAYFREEFLATLKILQSGDVREEDLRGSWAGAFGQTQFMPTTFLRLAVDFDKDGRRDLVGSEADALASTANYLAKGGWRQGEPWGFEVTLPPGFDARDSGRKQRKPVSYWASKGIARVDGAPLGPAARNAALILPAGARGPAFLVFRNYDVIFSYNAAESYSLAIALLADQLRGAKGLVAKWPTDDPGLSRAERRELQQLLAARGHDIGEIDGMIGKATREALAIEQKRLGLTADGRAGQKVLRALRN